MKNKSIGQLVAENGAYADVFEKHRIDYCCHGRLSLEEACKKGGISLDEVLSDLKSTVRAPDEKDWSKASLTELSQFIQQRYHRSLQDDLPGLLERMQRVKQVHGQARPELPKVNDLLNQLARDLLQHTAKEDKVLFPWICGLEKGEQRGGPIEQPIAVMTSEHDEAESLLTELREMTGGFHPPAGACNTYRNVYTSLQKLEVDMHRHIHLENNILFPGALQLAAEASASIG